MTDAWAAGSFTNTTTHAVETLALHWDGTSWSTLASPNPGGTSATTYNALNGVIAKSATNAWAVGGYTKGTTLVLRWNGTSWSTG